MISVRLSLVLLSFLTLSSPLFCAQVVYPAAQTRSKNTTLNARQSTSRKLITPAWARIPEDVVIRGDNDPLPLTQSRLPQETEADLTLPDDEEMIDESAFFGPAKSLGAPPLPPAEDDENMVELSFDNPDELLSSLGEVFQIDEETMNEIQNFDFSALADIDFSEDDFADANSGDSKNPSESFSLDSFNQFGDFSSLFGQD